MPSKISVVVPNFNGGQFIAECLESIVSQDWPDKEIIVVDGGSDDLSTALVRSYGGHIAHWESSPDGGQYHAIERGLNRATGDVLCWLNSDDRFFPGAFRDVMERFEAEPEMQWLSGAHSTFLAPRYASTRGMPRDSYYHAGDMGYVVKVTRTSQHVNWNWEYMLNQSPHSGYYLQQESTFWSRSLWQEVGGFDHTYRWACDYWLWMEFLNRAPLTLLDRPLGCFRQWSGQCTANRMEEYTAEVYDIVRRWKTRDQKLARAGRLAQTLGVAPDPNTFGGSQEITPIAECQSRQIRRVHGSVRDRLCLATSIAPRNIGLQSACVHTWLKQGCQVVSLNTPEEIEILKAVDDRNLRAVDYVPIEQTAREITGIPLPYLRDFVRYFQAQPASHLVGLINSDIRIDENVDLYSIARDSCSERSCLVSSRLDYDQWPPVNGNPNLYGFDVFLFQAGTLENYPLDTDYAIGAPWWDYYMVDFCLENFDTVYRCDPIPFYHKNHVAQYALDIWLRYGHRFMSEVQPDTDLGEEDPVLNGALIARNNELLNKVALQFTSEFQRRSRPFAPLAWTNRSIVTGSPRNPRRRLPEVLRDLSLVRTEKTPTALAGPVEGREFALRKAG
ncbi:MAG: glycosyltransferase family 2 protein [Planctomycetaceae bacterium]